MPELGLVHITSGVDVSVPVSIHASEFMDLPRELLVVFRHLIQSVLQLVVFRHVIESVLHWKKVLQVTFDSLHPRLERRPAVRRATPGSKVSRPGPCEYHPLASIEASRVTPNRARPTSLDETHHRDCSQILRTAKFPAIRGIFRMACERRGRRAP